MNKKASEKAVCAQPKIFLILLGLIGLLSIAAVLFFTLTQINTDITPQDEASLKAMYARNGYPELIGQQKADNFSTQISQIRKVQIAVLNSSLILKKIPVRQTREPEDLLEAGHGQCSDRARSILKGLQKLGFEARFAAIFSFDQTHMPPEQIARSVDDVRSHALIEVRTEKGWMMVDTNTPWISLDRNNNPISLDAWQDIADRADFQWTDTNQGEIYWLMKSDDLMVIYGLYSRHGLFYPPFTPYIPDINWRELIQTRLL